MVCHVSRLDDAWTVSKRFETTELVNRTQPLLLAGRI